MATNYDLLSFIPDTTHTGGGFYTLWAPGMLAPYEPGEPMPDTFELTDYSLPLGVHDEIHYNGFVFNQRYTLERARLDSLDGVMDSDIRESREERQDIDGELWYSLLRNGRNIALEGMLKAGNMHSLDRLRQRMKAACASREPSEMWFNRYDVVDDFSIAKRVQDYHDETPGTWTYGPGQAVPLDSSVKNVIRTSSGSYRDLEASLRFYTGASVGNGMASIWLKAINPSNGIHVTATSSALRIYKQVSGSDTQLASVNVSWSTSTEYWIVGRIEGDSVVAEVWTSEPAFGKMPLASVSHTLAGGDADDFGEDVQGYPGFAAIWTPPALSNVLREFRVTGIDPCDLVAFDVIRNSSLGGAEQQSDLRFRRPFRLNMRAADPIFYSRYAGILRTSPIVQPVYGTNLFDLTFDVAFDVPLSLAGTPLVGGTYTVHNLGDEATRPRVLFEGPLANTVVINVTNGTALRYRSSVAFGESVTVDCRKQTAYDALKNDRSAEVDPSSQLLKLDPGDNELVVYSDILDAANRVTIEHRSGWS